MLSRKIESFYECRVSSLLLQQEGEGEGYRARTRTRIHISQTVEITRDCSRFSREGFSSPRVSNPSRREIPIRIFYLPVSLLHVSANATRLRHSRHLDLRSQFSNDEEFAVSAFRLLRFIRFIISFFFFLLSST